MSLILMPALRRMVFFPVLGLAALTQVCAVDLKIDVNQRSAANNVAANTEAGFTPMAITSAASGAIAAATVNSLTIGAQTISITGTGSGNYDDRKRTAPVATGSFTQTALLQDFIFCPYAAANALGGLDIGITGLTPNKEYAITLWSFDSSSAGTRVSDWSANGLPKVNNYTFNGATAPTTNTQHQLNFTAIADSTGKILISGRRDATSVNNAATPAPEAGVFFNALWLRDLFLDEDNDQMSDVWEESHGLNTTLNDAALDPDNDFASNLQEFLADSDPQDNDTDNDTILDGYENKSGNWVSTTNTGTNPTLADTDGDGLPDNVENPDLPWLSPAQPGTNPNIYDSDNDGFSDGEEVNWPSNPRIAAEMPNPALGSTVGVDIENTVAVAQPGFQALLGSGTVETASLTSNYGNYSITISAAGSTGLLSRDRAAAAGGRGFNPLFRDFVFANNGADDGDGLDVTVTGLQPYTWYPVTLWSWDLSSISPARRSTWSASEGDVQVVKVPLYVLNTGTLPTGILDRRMKFDAKTDAAGNLLIQGRKEAGYVPAPVTGVHVLLNGLMVGPPVTPLSFTAVAGSQLTFTSDDFGVYEVLSSPDLTEWQTIAPAVDGLPGLTSFTDPAPSGPRMFYQVRRVAP